MWFPVAGSEQVQVGKTYAAQIANQGLVLFRNESGQVCVLEDRCPHRRVPLSLGKVIDGNLRCAYHGWTFDGLNGQCVAVPNLGEAEHIPASLCAKAFRATEQNRFIYVATLGSANTDTDFVCQVPAGWEYAKTAHGCAVVSVAADDYLAAMFDGPHVLFSLFGVHVSDFYIGDVQSNNGCLSLDRTAVWTLKAKPHEKLWGLSTLMLRTEIWPEQSAVRLQLLDAGEQILLAAVLAVVPSKRSTSQLHWRCYYSKNYTRTAPAHVRSAAALVACPFTVFSAIDGQALADLMVGPSASLVAAMNTPPGEEPFVAPVDRIASVDLTVCESTTTGEDS
jgi:nitrite reductase/ring-hydroxylating ferredoxin subunit